MFGSSRLPRSRALERSSTLVARAAQLLADWQAQLAAGPPSLPARSADPASGGQTLAEHLAALDRQIELFAPEVRAAMTEAAEWARRTVLALRAGHDEAARQALVRQQEYSDMARGLTEELIRLQALRAAVQELVTDAASPGHVAG